MKLTVFNGSPRRKKSNSTILTQKFIDGFIQNNKNEYEEFYLGKTKDVEIQIKAFAEAEYIMFIFPLYTDAMPGIVKYFIEHLSTLKKTLNKKIFFVVQSGFPEAIHSVYIEKYLEKLCYKLGVEYLGTVIKGGVEGIQMMPSSMTKKLFKAFNSLGKEFAETQTLHKQTVDKLRKPYKFTKTRLLIFRIMQIIGLANFYWNKKLKEHDAYAKRFAKPYA